MDSGGGGDPKREPVPEARREWMEESEGRSVGRDRRMASGGISIRRVGRGGRSLDGGADPTSSGIVHGQEIGLLVNVSAGPERLQGRRLFLFGAGEGEETSWKRVRMLDVDDDDDDGNARKS